LNAFLINIDFLQELKYLNGSINEDDLNTKNSYLIFGIFDFNVDLLKQVNSHNSTKLIIIIVLIIKSLNEIKMSGCSSIEARGVYLNKIVPTIYFIKCPMYEIQLNVFYKRGDYYWIGDDKSKKSDAKFFGDVPRGINKFKKRRKIINFFNFVFKFKI
jgi:hypothetical protein